MACDAYYKYPGLMHRINCSLIIVAIFSLMPELGDHPDGFLPHGDKRFARFYPPDNRPANSGCLKHANS